MLRSIFAALFAVLLAGPAFAADKVTLMLNWYVYGEHAPFYYGKEKDFFNEAGIDLEIDRKSTRLNSSHIQKSRMPSSA